MKIGIKCPIKRLIPVYFVIWGGLKIDGPHYGNVMLKILLNAGKSPNLGFAYDLLFILTTIIYVKIALTWRQSAGVRSMHTSEASQRLHAGDLSGKNNKLINSSNTLIGGLRIRPGYKAKLNLFERGFSTITSISPSYISGFSDGESCFHISIFPSPQACGGGKNKGYKTGFQVIPVDIDSVISLFSNYPLLGSKRLDFEDFLKIQGIIDKDLHKTEKGLEEIRLIKGKMNSKRIHEY